MQSILRTFVLHFCEEWNAIFGHLKTTFPLPYNDACPDKFREPISVQETEIKYEKNL